PARRAHPARHRSATYLRELLRLEPHADRRAQHPGDDFHAAAEGDPGVGHRRRGDREDDVHDRLGMRLRPRNAALARRRGTAAGGSGQRAPAHWPGNSSAACFPARHRVSRAGLGLDVDRLHPALCRRHLANRQVAGAEPSREPRRVHRVRTGLCLYRCRGLPWTRYRARRGQGADRLQQQPDGFVSRTGAGLDRRYRSGDELSHRPANDRARHGRGDAAALSLLVQRGGPGAALSAERGAGRRVAPVLKGKRALVTGGSRGLGRAICAVLAEYGADVAFNYSGDQEGAEATLQAIRARERRARAFRASVLDEPALNAMVKNIEGDWGGIDILVNNAGVSQPLPLPLMEESDWDLVMDVNVKGQFLVSRAVLRGMIRRRAGALLNIGSLAGLRLIEAPVHYAASKAAIKGFTQALAKEVARYQIRVNCLAPGLLEEGVGQSLPEHRMKEYLRHVSLRRLGTLDEVARFAAF